MFFYLIISYLIFIFGIWGVFLTSTHIIILLISLELMLLSLNISFVSFSVFIDDIFGQIISLIMLVMAAAESALGLALLVIYYSFSGGISIDLISLLKG